MGGDFANRARINMKDADYLKQLIYLATGGRRVVAMGAKGKGLQFYMIKGGGEGFLKPYYKGKDASRHVTGDGATTGNSSGGVTMIFDNNDLLAVFDSEGKLLGSALLKRPISIVDPSEKDPHVWTEGTANLVYDAWDGQPVTLFGATATPYQRDGKFFLQLPPAGGEGTMIRMSLLRNWSNAAC